MKHKWIAQLNEEVTKTYDELGLQENKIGRLPEYKHFCEDGAPYQHQPDLMASVFKASQVRYLVPVATRLCHRFHKDGDHYSNCRLKCLESLATSYDIVDRSGLFLGGDAEMYQHCTSDFVSNYAELHAIAVSRDEKQWALRPKLHYVAHISV